MRSAFRVAVLAALAFVPFTHAATATKPNVIVIMTDDQTVEQMRVLPNVRSLIGDQGVTFDNSFVAFSLCCPSRATFLTGQYGHSNGVLGNTPPQGGYTKLDHSNTLAVWLQKAGYSTIHLGKYLNGYGAGAVPPTTVPPGWTEWHGFPDSRGTYSYYDYDVNDNGTLTHYGLSASDYKTDVITQRAVEIVRRRSAEAQPFFLWVAYLAPHAGGPANGQHPAGTPLPAPRHLGKLAAEPLPMPPSFNEADVSDKPRFVQQLPLLNAQQIEAVHRDYELRNESLLSVDEGVAAIVGALQQAGTLQNTVVVFTSDNGFFQGEHRIPTGKVHVYEPSTRVPLLVRGPGIPAGLRLAQPVSNIDVAPTIADYAGAVPERTTDGRSLRALLSDRGLAWGRDLLEEGPGVDPARRRFTAIRTPRYLYAEYRAGDRELYDLQADPDQLQSHAGDPAYAAIQGELARRLALLRDCRGTACQAQPAISLAARIDKNCRVLLSLGGATAGIVRTDFVVGGRRVASDARPPFGTALRKLRGRTLARAHAFFADGREATWDPLESTCRHASLSIL